MAFWPEFFWVLSWVFQSLFSKKFKKSRLSGFFDKNTWVFFCKNLRFFRPECFVKCRKKECVHLIWFIRNNVFRRLVLFLKILTILTSFCSLSVPYFLRKMQYWIQYQVLNNGFACYTIQNVPLDIENICLIYVVYLLKRIRLLFGFGNIITTKSNFMICQGKKRHLT